MLSITTPIATLQSVVRTQGAVLVNEGYVHRRGDNVVAAYVDLKSKRAEYAGAIYEGGKPPVICLDASEETLHIDESKKGETTLVEFPDFVGWTVFSAHVSKYTLAVVFVA